MFNQSLKFFSDFLLDLITKANLFLEANLNYSLARIDVMKPSKLVSKHQKRNKNIRDFTFLVNFSSFNIICFVLIIHDGFVLQLCPRQIVILKIFNFYINTICDERLSLRISYFQTNNLKEKGWLGEKNVFHIVPLQSRFFNNFYFWRPTNVGDKCYKL